MLFGFVAIVFPPASSWSHRYVSAYTTLLLQKHHRCRYHLSTCASASSACGGRHALSTAIAMYRAMAMTALILALATFGHSAYPTTSLVSISFYCHKT